MPSCARRGERATILVATSGDTGSAAIAGCIGREALDIVVLHPAGRISDVQRRQMTTVDAANVHNLAVDGTFDDCQALVKALLAEEPLRTELRLAAMNSINWTRVAAQVGLLRLGRLAARADLVRRAQRELRQRARPGGSPQQMGAPSSTWPSAPGATISSPAGWRPE